MARLKPGVTPQQAQAELAAVSDRLREQFPTDNGNLSAPRVLKLQDEIVGEYKQMLSIIFSVVIAVLIIACFNLANLQLARASARHHELAIRSALGASRWQILRQLLSEGGLLTLAGGAFGLLLAGWGKDLLIWFAPSDFPRASDAPQKVYGGGGDTFVAVIPMTGVSAGKFTWGSYLGGPSEEHVYGMAPDGAA